MLREDQHLSERSSRPYGQLVAGARLFSKAELLQLAAVCAMVPASRWEATVYCTDLLTSGVIFLPGRPGQGGGIKASVEQDPCRQSSSG